MLIVAKCSAKKKSIHLSNQEYSDYTAQDASLSDCEDFLVGNINFESLNPSDDGGINSESTNNRNPFTERLSDNSNN